jgi:glycolate oxidase
MEFMERKAVLAAEALLEKKAPYREAEAHLLVQLDGEEREELQKTYERIGEIVSDHGALDVLVAEDRPSQDRLWEIRRSLSEALTAKSPIREREDVVVPKSKIPQLFRELDQLQKKYSTEIVSFGHIGDGNIHVNILKGGSQEDEWKNMLPELLAEMFTKVVELGGTISGEHGIGFVKKKYLPIAVDAPSIKAMKAIKESIDPDNILNPEKIFIN